MEGSGVGSAGCVVNIEVRASELCCGRLQLNMADMGCLICRRLWSEQC